MLQLCVGKPQLKHVPVVFLQPEATNKSFHEALNSCQHFTVKGVLFCWTILQSDDDLWLSLAGFYKTLISLLDSPKIVLKQPFLV